MKEDLSSAMMASRAALAAMRITATCMSKRDCAYACLNVRCMLFITRIQMALYTECFQISRGMACTCGATRWRCEIKKNYRRVVAHAFVEEVLGGPFDSGLGTEPKQTPRRKTCKKVVEPRERRRGLTLVRWAAVRNFQET